MTRLLVDLVLALTAIEMIALPALHRATGRGPAAADLLPNLAAGLFLLLALRAALAGVAWPGIALCLAGAGLSHLLDLRRRWPR